MTDVLNLRDDCLRGFLSNLLPDGEVLHAQHVSCIIKNKHEAFVLGITRHRIILFNVKSKKLEYNIHFLLLNSVTSSTTSLVTLSTEKLILCIEATDVDLFLLQIFYLTVMSFPSCQIRNFYKYKILPESREEGILAKLSDQVEDKTEWSLLETFRPAYETICNFQNTSVNESVLWTIEKIYYPKSEKVLCLNDFDHLESSQMIALLSTLKYTAWFKEILCCKKKLPSEVITKVLETYRDCAGITSLRLSGIGVFGESLELLTSPEVPLTSLDLSCNNLDDKEMFNLSNCLYKATQITHLNLSYSTFTAKGLKALTDSLKQSCSSTLKSLLLNHCGNVRSDGWGCFSDLLCHCVSLEELSIADNSISIDTLWTPLQLSCVSHLQKLNLANCRYTNTRLDLSKSANKATRFIQTSQELAYINLSGCKLPAEVTMAIVSAISDNILLTNITLNLAGNDIGLTNTKDFCEQLVTLPNVTTLILRSNNLDTQLPDVLEALSSCRYLKHLDIGDNVCRTKEKTAVVSALYDLVNDSTNNLQSLDIANMKLKSDLFPFLGCLAYNKKLTKLNISGNLVGNTGIRMLSQSLSVNKHLRYIALDNNQIGVQGLQDLRAGLKLNRTLQNVKLPYNDIVACFKSSPESVITSLNQITEMAANNNAPRIDDEDNLLLKQQQYILSSSENLQLDSAVVGLYDTLTRASGKRGDDFVEKKKLGLALLKEAEKCYNLMGLLHEKADSKRKEIYSSVQNTDVYQETATRICDVVNTELGNLSMQYMSSLEATLPKLLDNLPDDDGKGSVLKYCKEKCKIKEDPVLNALTKTFQQELSMIIGKCMLQAENKITTFVLESMVSRINSVTSDVEKLNTKEEEKKHEAKIIQDDGDIDESIKQRRFTYTEKRKNIVKDEVRSSSLSGKPKPAVPAKPASLRSEERLNLLDDNKSTTDVASVKSNESDVKSQQSVVEDVVQETTLDKDVVVTSTEAKDEHVISEPQTEEEKLEVEEEKIEVGQEDDLVADIMAKVEEDKREDDEQAATEGKKVEEVQLETPENEEQQEVEPEVKSEVEVDAADPSPKEASSKNVEVMENDSPLDFGEISQTVALTSITKSRARGPKKKARPTKTSAITTLDPFQVASGTTEVRPETQPEELSPSPEKKKPLIPTNKPMMPGMNNMDLMNALNKRKKKAEGVKEEDTTESGDSKPSPESSAASAEQTTPKKKPFRPPGAFAMPGLGGIGMSKELNAKLSARKDTSEAAKSPEVKGKGPPPPRPPKPKSKGAFSLFRSHGSVGSGRTKSDSDKQEGGPRSKSLGEK